MGINGIKTKSQGYTRDVTKFKGMQGMEQTFRGFGKKTSTKITRFNMYQLTTAHQVSEAFSFGISSPKGYGLGIPFTLRYTSHIDPYTNVPQYPLYPVYGYHPSTVARQVGALGIQGSTTMSSSLVDNSVNTNLSQVIPASTMLVWTKVGEIVFPVYTTTPISTGPSMTGNENAVATNQGESMSKNPPAETENGASMTSKLEKDSDAAKPCHSDMNHEPTKMTSEAARSWCPIHKTLQAC
uniref:Uncharacterized protein n=1 Tax=Oryza sativa subsp. japonica TaxID=39947 RepID=Q2QUN4_ORYSJ|nr:hypothetical protein LOC_Os12g15660 [Oryza sativa Japonica Group]